MSIYQHLKAGSVKQAQTCEIAFALLLLLGLVSLTPASNQVTGNSSQAPQQVLKLGEPQSPEIRGGKTQPFTIKLAKDEFAEISIEQHGAMLVATLFDPQNVEVIQMDYQGGGYGPIYLSAVAKTEGNYRLEVTSINAWALPKKYEVTVNSLRPAASRDRALFNAQLAFSRGRKNFAGGKFPEALAAYNESLVYWQSSQDYHWQAVTWFAMAEAYGNRDRVNREKSLNEALRILDEKMAPNDWRLKASVLNDLGNFFGNAGQMDKGLKFLEDARELYAAKTDARGQASALGNMGRIHLNAGNLSLAREFAEKALALRNHENDKPGASNMINALAAIFDRLGEPEQSLVYSAKALSEWEGVAITRPQQRDLVAAILNNQAAASDKLGRWDTAFEFYDKALNKYDEDDPARASTLDNKGELYAALGNPDKARECYQEALRLLDKAGKPNPDIKASVLVHLGQLSLADDDVTSALKYFEDARSLKPADYRLSDVLTNLGTALAVNNEFDKAIGVYQNALDLQVKLNDPRGQALTLQKRGEARVRRGEPDKGLNDLNQALVLWRVVKDRRGEATTLNDIAQLERDRGSLTTALERSDEAIQTIESLRTNISSHQLRASYLAAQDNYYELNVDLKMQLSKKENRSDYLASALESAEKSRARVLLDALNEAGLSRGEFNSDPNFAKLLEERSNLLNKLSAKIQARTDSFKRAHTPEQAAAFDREIQQLTDSYEALEIRIRSRNPRFATLTKPQPSNVKEIQTQLDEQTILIEYLLGETRSYVWVVTRNSLDGFELPPRAQIEALAQRVYDGLSARGTNEKNESFAQKNDRVAKAENDLAPASALLSEMILGKIAHLLGEKRLLIVGDGKLQALPFGVLPTPATQGATVQDLLVAQHEIVSFPSASVLVLQRRELAGRKPAPYALALIADPVFDEMDSRVKGQQSSNARSEPKKSTPEPTESSSQTRALSDITGGDRGAIRRLGYASDEASAILSMVAANQSFKALNFDANRPTLLSPKLSRYRIIHLATHGIMNPIHPELSGVILSLVDKRGRATNGYVGLNDIYSLNLPADLVVLSACETGIGKQVKGEGLIALTRGFMHAGAERVVASLWKVDDQATAELMPKFYREMLVNKRKPAAALRAVQLEFYRRNQKPHLWAGFVLQGEWR